MIIFNIEKRFNKLGFFKVRENNYIVQYERKTEFGYIQCLDIAHKDNGKHIICSYQKDINKDGFNNSVGLTCDEAILAVKKMKKKWK